MQLKKTQYILNNVTKPKISKKYKLSIIVTIFNLADVLVPCLISIENQTEKPLEVILVDDGSTDDSVKIIQDFLKRNSNWKCLSTSNKGVGSARNLGITCSQGDYVLILDGDDIFDRNFFQFMMNETLDDPDIVICKSRELDHITNLSIPLDWSVKFDFLPHENRFSPDDLQGTIFYSFMGWAWDKMYKREFLIKNNLKFPTYRNSEDLVFVYKSLFMAQTIKVINKSLIFHRVNRFQSVSNTLDEYPEEFHKALRDIEDALLARPEIFSREKECYLAWKVDFSLWAQRSSCRAFSPEYFKELRRCLLLSGQKRKLFPLLKFRLEARSPEIKRRYLAVLTDMFSSYFKYGVKRHILRFLSFSIIRIKKFYLLYLRQLG